MKSSLILSVAFALMLTIASSATACPQNNQCQQPTCPSGYSFNGSTCVTVSTISIGLGGISTRGNSRTNQIVTPTCPTGYTLLNEYCIRASNTGSNSGSNSGSNTGSNGNSGFGSCSSGYFWDG